MRDGKNLPRKLSKAARSAAIKAGIARARRERVREARQRSERARKGWETRRKKARSEAAKRGHETRRKREKLERKIQREAIDQFELEAEEYVAIGEYIGD
jgi:hypothetical protein